MKNRSVAYGIIVAAAVALTGCGNAGTAENTTTPADMPAASAGTGPTQAMTPSASAEPSEKSTTAAATPSAAAKAYTNDELAAMVAKLQDPNGQQFTVIPAAQIDQGLQVAQELLKTAEITPKECAVMATNNAQIPEGSTYAAGSSLSAADKTSITVTVFAVEDASSLAEQLSTNQKAATQCETVTIAVAGKESTVKLTPVPVTTTGDTSLGTLASETAPTGEEVSALTVTAVKGNLAASVAKTGAAIAPDASGELVKLVDAILASQ